MVPLYTEGNLKKITDKDIMEKARKEYTRWGQANLPEDLREELQNIKKNDIAVYDRFCKDLTFGTSGLRGKMGVGPNMINSVVLRRATDGVIDYLLSKHKAPMVVISYDTRINSMEYACLLYTSFKSRLFPQERRVSAGSLHCLYCGDDAVLILLISNAVPSVRRLEN